MDKNSIKKYAVWARRELIERVSQRAMIYGITAENAGDPNAESVNGHLLSQAEKRQRQTLIRSIKEKGYEQVMEEVAYTWFNRFAALRFMEVNGYLPSHIRVFTNDAGEFKPQILAEAIHLELAGLDMNKVYELENSNKSEELFKYLLIVQCNALNSILPGMFQRIEDYTELLLPDYLLREGSVIEQMVTTIPEEDWTDQVQIIGWLYQYYNTEPKDKVFADLKKNIKITKENIPAATQLFTPDWIVHYMVENSLGRLWLEGHPNDALKSEWKYYLDEAEQEPDVEAQLAAIRKEYAALKPEEIRVIDPCCGSGHILCVLFDVLVQIYTDYGYTAQEAAQNIVRNNLHGLDIDPRAVQLSYFTVMMKARQYDRRFFTRNIMPMVYSPEGYSEGLEYGSLINVEDLEPAPNIDNWTIYDGTYETALNRWNYRAVLNQRYDVVVTNPPYMGASNMNPAVSQFIKDNYADYKSDFFAAFMVRCSRMTKPEGYCGFFTPYVWMFIQSYEKLRQFLYNCCTIETLIQFEYSAFEEATVPVCTLVFKNYHLARKKGCYFRLTDFRGGMEVQRKKTLEAITNHDCGYYYEQTSDNFAKIPGAPVAYWVTQNTISNFSYGSIKDFFRVGHGVLTGHDEGFIFCWYEVNNIDISYNSNTHDEMISNNYKYCPMAKGGEFRKWYGNLWFILRFDKEGIYGMSQYPKYTPQNSDLYFKQGMTWTEITSGNLGARYLPSGCIFNHKGPSGFGKTEEDSFRLLGFMGSVVSNYYGDIINPTITCSAGVVNKFPAKNIDDWPLDLVKRCVRISKDDWDSFETSWDFQRHPMLPDCSDGLNYSYRVENFYHLWETQCEERFHQLKSNEEELNRIFIDIYGLQDELTPSVHDKDVTVHRADLKRDIKSLISYAVGCMFGRYSLDTPGLAYAGGEWDNQKYTMFIPDADAILPICDDEYFEDDIVGRFVEFIEIVYGKKTLEENLQFIANALGGKGSSREIIRDYFLSDFYKDHCATYSVTGYGKRPIYWLFDSGKKNGFKCLIYMHRYQPDTIARIRTDYVHEQQSRYRTAIADLEQRINGTSSSERVKLSKQLVKLQAQADEIRVYEEKIHHLADKMIQIDLDDGVKHNYEIFKDVLAKIK